MRTRRPLLLRQECGREIGVECDVNTAREGRAMELALTLLP